MTPLLEKQIEAKVGEYVKSLGGLYWKFTSPANPSVPDRIIIFPGDRIGWLELKREGCKPTAKQQAKMNELRDKGCTVAWVDTVATGKAFADKVRKLPRGEGVEL